jgi:hypothetical protein
MYSQKTIQMISAIICLLWGSNSFAISVSQLSRSLRAKDLVAELIDTTNSQITISRTRHRGAYQAFGIFSGGMADGLGIESGVILTTGKVTNAIGPNSCYKTTTVNRRSGDSNLQTLGQGTTYDAAALEFDFIPQGDTLKFEYVFASEEYHEWVGSKFNDVFAFFLDNQNIAIVPKSSTPVAINTINKWSNSQYYHDNEYPFPSSVTDYNTNRCSPGNNTSFLTEFDGFTTVLTAVAKVTPGKRHHMKLVIADRGDFSLDSAVFIKGKSFTLVVPPPATTLISPTGIIDTNTPTFSWQEVSSTTIYKLQLIDSNNNVLIDNQYYADEIACDSNAGSCSVTPETFLPDGTYQWQVQTQNQAGVAQDQAGNDLWSNTLSFTVKTIPDPATLVAPLGNFLKCTQAPTYQWQPAALATKYFLHIKDEKNQIFERWYHANEVNCVDETTTCSVTPSFQPAEGLVQWQIKTANSKGEGPWSTTGSFTLKCPPTPTTLVPSGTNTGNPIFPGTGGQSISGTPLPVNNPTSYSWEVVPDTTLYRLQILDQAGKVIVNKWYSAARLNCGPEQPVCSVDLAVDLPDGNYQWQVQTRNEVGSGPWSQPLPMTIKLRPDAATLIAPTATLLNCQQNPTYSWQVAYLATRYLLSVQDVLGVTTERWYSDIEANCTTTTCSVTPDFPVVEGNVQWRVKTANQKGEGPWSAPLSFTVKCPPPPTTLLEAIPATDSNMIAYSWKAVPSATLYQLRVKNHRGKIVLRKWYSAATLNCNSGQEHCLTNLGINLPDGTYQWEVRTRNEIGYGDWSNTLPLIIKTLPDAATLVSPTATLLNCTHLPTYIWKPANLATKYLLSVQDASKLTERWYSNTEANCTDTLCSVTPDFHVVVGNVNWRVKTANSKGEGPWSGLNSFAVKCPPPATTLISPTGVINDNTPTYSWNAIPAATTYRLQVLDANNQIVVDETEINCNISQGACSFTPEPKLLDGSYTWKVQTHNQVGTGAWSETLPMIIKVLPDAATLIAPTQTFVNCNQSPTYSWKPAELATQYLLSVQDSVEITERWYSSTEANCTSSNCSVTPDFKPAEGNVSWRIQTANQEGTAPWSETLAFTMKCPPTTTTLISGDAMFGSVPLPPGGGENSLSGLPLAQKSPTTYKWHAIPGATLYQLQIKDSQGQIVMEQWYSASDLNCSNPDQIICFAHVNLNLPDDNYQWQVRVRNEVSSSSWSEPSSFTVKMLPDAAALISPTQMLVNCNEIPTYSWQPAALATRYLLSVQDNQGVIERWYSNIEANCTTTTCSIAPDFQLAGGEVQWRIKSANPTGEGSWSETLAFVVQCPPTATTLISPSGVISDNTPSYTWNTLANATIYQLQVTDADNQVIVEETISNCHSDQPVCTFNSTMPLADGNYSWNVQTQNQVGDGPWSQALSFTVLTTPLAATLVSPQVTLHHNLPTYTWQAVAKADQYLLQVQDASGQVFEQTYTSAEANCSEVTHLCSVTPDQELAEGEAQWWIQTANSSGLGPLSTAMSFAIEKVTTCKFYAVNDEQLNDSQFLVIDPQTTEVTTLGALYVDHDIEALDASLETEQLYAAAGKDGLLPGVLYTVDHSTGQLNLLSDLGLGDISGLSFNPVTGILWGWSPNNGLFWVDVNQLPLLPQFEWLSTMRVDDLSWNEDGTVLYLAQRNKILRYEGSDRAKPTTRLCTLPEEHRIEAMEIISPNQLLIGIDGQDTVYTTINVDSNNNCVIEAFEILETPYQDIEGMTLGCTRHYLVE